MKKLFDFARLNFFKPRCRKVRPSFTRLETLQTRTVPAAISGAPIDDAGQDEVAAEPEVLVETTEDSSGDGEVFAVTTEFADETLVDEEIEFVDGSPDDAIFYSFASIGAPQDGGGGEVTDGEIAEEEEIAPELFDEFGTPEDIDPTWVKNDFDETPQIYYMMGAPADDIDGSESEDGRGEVVLDKDEITDEETTGETTEEFIDESIDGEKNDSDVPVDDISIRLRTLTSSSGDEETVSEEAGDVETLEDVVIDKSIDGDDELLPVDGGGEFNPEIYYSAAGGGEEFTPTSVDDGNVEDGLEIQTLGGGLEVTTFNGVLDLGLAEYMSAADEFQADVHDHIGDLTQLVTLFSNGLVQNSHDIGTYAAAGDTAGIHREVEQNRVLVEQYAQFITAFINDLTTLAQRYVTRITSASQAIQFAAANPQAIGTASSSFSQQRLARPIFISELDGRMQNLQDVIDRQNIVEGDDQGFTIDEPNGDSGLETRMRQGNTQATASVSEIGLSLDFTAFTENVAQPASGETVTINVGLINTDDTLGDEPLYVSGISGTVDLTGTDDGAAITGGKLTIDGVKDAEPFSIDVMVPSDVEATVTFDANGILTGLSGDYALPITEGLLPAGGTLVVNMSITPTAV